MENFSVANKGSGSEALCAKINLLDNYAIEIR